MLVYELRLSIQLDGLLEYRCSKVSASWIGCVKIYYVREWGAGDAIAFLMYNGSRNFLVKICMMQR